MDWCFNGASPPLTVEVSDPIPAPAVDGKVCYVIYVPESDVAPHFLNGRKGVWIRSDEFSARFEAQLADDNELRHLLDRRKLTQERLASVMERARRRFDTYAGRTHTARSGIRTRFGPRLEICVVPRFPARPLCEQGDLEPLIRAKTLKWRGAMFPVPSSNIVSQHESAILLDAVGDSSMFEANVWGMLFYCTKIGETYNPSETGLVIHLHGFVGHTLLFIHHADAMLQALGYAGPIRIEATISSILRTPWLYASGSSSAIFSGSELDDEVSFSITTTNELLREKPNGVATDLLRYVFFSVNWPDLINTPRKLEDLILKGYAYNSWPHPDNLQC